MSKPARRTAVAESTSVKVAQFKAHLSECLRRVRRGEALTVCDRDQPIARVMPFGRMNTLTIQRGRGSPRDIPLRRARGGDSKVTSLTMLLADRRESR